MPACVAFVPRATKLLVYSSSLLLGKLLVYDYRLATVVRSVSVTQVWYGSERRCTLMQRNGWPAVRGRCSDLGSHA